MNRKAKVAAIVSLTIGVLCGGLYASPYGQTFRTLSSKGFFTDTAGSAKFEGDSAARLKAQYTALMLFHQSEDRFPEGKTWMKDIANRLVTFDLKEGEAAKKLIRPDLEGQAGKHGYALNDAVANKYKGDLKDPKMVLVYESKQEAESAHGDPKQDGRPGGQAVLLDGSIVKL